LQTDACFVVKDHNGQALAYIYFENEPGQRTAVGAAIGDNHIGLLLDERSRGFCHPLGLWPVS
jgi:hypothetical protein